MGLFSLCEPCGFRRCQMLWRDKLRKTVITAITETEIASSLY